MQFGQLNDGEWVKSVADLITTAGQTYAGYRSIRDQSNMQRDILRAQLQAQQGPQYPSLPQYYPAPTSSASISSGVLIAGLLGLGVLFMLMQKGK